MLAVWADDLNSRRIWHKAQGWSGLFISPVIYACRPEFVYKVSSSPQTLFSSFFTSLLKQADFSLSNSDFKSSITISPQKFIYLSRCIPLLSHCSVPPSYFQPLVIQLIRVVSWDFLVTQLPMRLLYSMSTIHFGHNIALVHCPGTLPLLQMLKSWLQVVSMSMIHVSQSFWFRLNC